MSRSPSAHVGAVERPPISGPGRVIYNPLSGERIVVRQSGAQTGGQRLCFDLFLPPGAHVPATHAHPIQEERFTVVVGLMRFRVQGRNLLVGPGETIVIPPGAAHWFGNASDEVAQLRVEARPSLRLEELFQTTAALGQAGRPWLTRARHIVRLPFILLDFQQELAVPHVPACLMRALLAALAWLRA